MSDPLPTPPTPPAPVPPAGPPAPPAPPAAPTPPTPAKDEDSRLAAMVEAKIREAWARLTDAPAPGAPPPGGPPSPPGGGGDPGSLDERVAAAVSAALAKRDSEDQQFVLAQQIKELQTKILGPKRKSWGSILLGPW